MEAVQAQPWCCRDSTEWLNTKTLAVVVVQLLNHVQSFVTPRTAACQASLSILISWCLLKLMSFESMMPSNRLILYHPLLLLPSISPSIRVFPSKSALCIRWPEYWNFSISPSMNIQGWFLSGLTSLMSLQPKGLSRISSNTTVEKHQFFSAQPSSWSNPHICTWPLEKS